MVEEMNKLTVIENAVCIMREALRSDNCFVYASALDILTSIIIYNDEARGIIGKYMLYKANAHETAKALVVACLND